jgi:amino acid permease
MENNYMDVVKFYAENPKVYWYSVYMPIAVWMLMVLVFFVFLLKKYTFGDWTKDNPNPYDGETFNMPRGVFRGILTLSLLFVTVIMELANFRIIGMEQEFQEFLVAFQMMIAFYFGSKVMHHITSTERQKTQFMAEAQSGVNMQQEDMSSGDFNNSDAEG